MVQLRQEGSGVVVVGPEGTFTFDRDCSPGAEGADGFGGGESFEYLFRVFERPDRLIVVVSRVVEHYGRSSTDTVYESRDGGRSFEVRPTEPAPQGEAHHFLYVK